MTTPNTNAISSNDYLSEQSYINAYDHINAKLPVGYKDRNTIVGIVCGSGLGGLVHLLQEPIVEFKYEDIPFFGVSTVLGHEGRLVFGMLSGQPTVCMVGRKHMYEGHSSIKTAFPIRVLSLLGIKLLIVTNAVGALNKAFSAGDIMVISDHISFPGLAGQNPLIGKNLDMFGERFPATSDSYDFDLRMTAFKAADQVGLSESIMREGVYAYVSGPTFESRAEARYLRAAGADVVGMSTVPEVARQCGIKVLGFSLVTNGVSQSVGRSAKEAYMASKESSQSALSADIEESYMANHLEVLEAGKQMSKQMQSLVERVIQLQYASAK